MLKLWKSRTDDHQHRVQLKDGHFLKADAVVLQQDSKLFEAERKEEYGYKIYDNVITSADLEEMLNKSHSGQEQRQGKYLQGLHLSIGEDRGQESRKYILFTRMLLLQELISIEMKQIMRPQRFLISIWILRMYGQNFEENFILKPSKSGEFPFY